MRKRAQRQEGLDKTKCVLYNQPKLAMKGISKLCTAYKERESLVRDSLGVCVDPTLELCMKIQRVSSVNRDKESDKVICC